MSIYRVKDKEKLIPPNLPTDNRRKEEKGNRQLRKEMGEIGAQRSWMVHEGKERQCVLAQKEESKGSVWKKDGKREKKKDYTIGEKRIQLTRYVAKKERKKTEKSKRNNRRLIRT